jgi:RNA polymerase sigma factor (sigma-70 family)
MATHPLATLLEYVRQAARPREADTDAGLLEAFVRRRDGPALEALVRRHAAMVWGVCRRTLPNHHDAEDAFQATFLVLVRRAASIRSPELLANWLYGVAYTTARKARQVGVKRSNQEGQVPVMPEPPAVESADPLLGAELWPLLDEEISRLPDKFRTAIVLCDLEGRNRAEAARQLGVPEGTVASRVARGRAILARQLARRGITVSGTALAAALCHQAASGSVPAALLAAGEAMAAGAVSSRVADLATEVVAAMVLGKYKAVGVMLLIATLVLSGGVATYHILAGQSVPPEPPPAELRPPDPEADIERFGREEDAKEFAERSAGIIQLHLIDDSIMGRGLGPATKARLDRETGQWTVTGTIQNVLTDWVKHDLHRIWEGNWKAVVRYTPSSRSWDRVSIECPGALDHDRKGWRPVAQTIPCHFVEPKRSDTPVTCLQIVSKKGDVIGPGESCSYTGKDFTVQTSIHRISRPGPLPPPPWPKDMTIPVIGNSVTIRAGGPGANEWTLKLERHGRILEVGQGEFECFDRVPTIADLGAWQARRGLYLGRFVVREAEATDQEIARLAIDFILHCHDNVPPLCGSLRVNSSFQSSVPVPGQGPVK